MRAGSLRSAWGASSKLRPKEIVTTELVNRTKSGSTGKDPGKFVDVDFRRQPGLNLRQGFGDSGKRLSPPIKIEGGKGVLRRGNLI